jgi:hypothetical protein
MGKPGHRLPRRPTRLPRQITLRLLRTWARQPHRTIHPRLLRSAPRLQRRLHRPCTAQLLQCTALLVPLTAAAVVVSTSNHLLLRTIPPLLQASARPAQRRQQAHPTLRPVPCTTAVPPHEVRALGRLTLPQVHNTRLTVLSIHRRKS